MGVGEANFDISRVAWSICRAVTARSSGLVGRRRMPGDPPSVAPPNRPWVWKCAVNP